VKYSTLPFLACPSCRCPDLVLETMGTETRPTTVGHHEADLPLAAGVDLEARTFVEVMEGALHCPECSAVYPIREGIPRLLPAGVEEGPSSAHRWTTFDVAEPAWEETFRDYLKPTQPGTFLGQTVLDAGCGYGRHAYFASRYGAEVLALDSSGDAVEACAKNTAGLVRVHVVQGDINHPPLREAHFDHAYALGVLHHLSDPDTAFRQLTALTKPGGRTSLWVYGPRQGAAHQANELLRGMTADMGPDEVHSVAKGIASVLRVVSHTPYRFLGHLPVAGEIVSHLPVHDHHKWPYPVVVADIYDRLRIPVTHWFKGELLERMYIDAGYLDVQVTRRVKNNESFRASGIRR
jgi:SAM-dependent methyltransferase/uncharacterized protein YbaR (Trm112 family)